MGLLDGKTALITGASRGIGKAIAERFAEEGANLILTDLFYDDNAKALEADLNAKGIKAKMYASDASNFEDTARVVEEAMKEFDGIQILVNNAGITRDTLLLRMTEEQWDQVIHVNLKSVFNLTKAVQRIMIKQREGSIINMSSVVGVGGNAGQANYSASKAGMIGFTKSIARELGSRNIRCNAIAPGFILTEMTDKLGDDVKKAWAEQIPLKRGGTADEVAKVAVFLGSDLSSYVSGQVVQVCGAMMT